MKNKKKLVKEMKDECKKVKNNYGMNIACNVDPNCLT